MPRPPFPQSIHAGQFREGHAWKTSDLEKWIIAGGLEWAFLDPEATDKDRKDHPIMSDVEEAYNKANAGIESAREAYHRILNSFRSTIKTDLSSIGASANRVRDESVKMADAYNKAIALLTSPEMASAIANAERLAAALSAISALQSHSITFAVLDKKPTP